MSVPKGKILVIRGGAIGDFILTLPAIAALRRQFPECHLEVLGYPHIIQLAVAGGLVDRAQSIEARALAGFFARNGDLSEDLADYFSEFDVIVSYLYDPDQVFSTNVRRCTTAQFIVGPHRPDERSQLHATHVYLQPLERLAIFEPDPVPQLQIKPQPTMPNQWALHPGSGSERKNWPEDKWAELLNRLINETSLNLLMVGGVAEAERLQRLTAALPPTRARVARDLPLPELAGLLQGSRAFIGHDSGISHLASALGLPGILLWGETREAIWRPPSVKMALLRDSRGLAHLSPDSVFSEVMRLANRLADR